MEDYLKALNILSNKEIEEVLKLGKYKSLSKNEYLTKEGSVCKEVAFVISGIFRSFYYSSSEEEITYCFTFPNNLIAAYSSFISQEKTIENIQALTEVELFVIPKSELDRLQNSSTNWLRFFKEMAEQQYIALEKRIFLLQKEIFPGF